MRGHKYVQSFRPIYILYAHLATLRGRLLPRLISIMTVQDSPPSFCPDNYFITHFWGRKLTPEKEDEEEGGGGAR